MPDTRPDIVFIDGVCTGCCSYANRPEIDWDARLEELKQLLDRHDGRCLVPSSGGKDSTFQCLFLRDLGADVTAITATTCDLTPEGRANINNLGRYVRTIEVTPNRTVRAKLNRIGLRMVGDISWPEHVSIHRTPFRMACDLKTPLLFYGECPTEAYAGPVGTQDVKVMTQRWASEFAGFLGLRPQDLIGIDGITERDMQDYACPNDDELERAGVEAHFLGQYIPWDSHRNAQVAKEHGMIQVSPGHANWWDFENIDSFQTGLHDYLMYRKYGYGRGCAQISIDIRAGKIGREEALAWVEAHDGAYPEFYMGGYIEDILARIGVTLREFDVTIDRFTNKSLFQEAGRKAS
jgi:hypothetical protein